MCSFLIATTFISCLAAPAAVEEMMVVDMSRMTRGELLPGFRWDPHLSERLLQRERAQYRHRPLPVRTGRQDGEGLLRDEPAGDGDVGRRAGAWLQDAAAALAAENASGIVIRNSAPLLAWFSADIWPSCAAMMVRAMDNPIPMPLGL